MKIIQQAKSIDRLIKQMKRDKGTRRAKRGAGDDTSEDEISNLIQMQREAVQSAMEQSAVKPVGAFKGIRAAEKIQEEYQVAKTGVRSRIGKFAKVLGAGEKEASTLEGLFGKKVPEEELAQLREKFKIKTPEQIKAEKEQQEAEKKAAKEAMRAEKQEKAQKRQEQFDRIENLAERIADMVESIQQTIQGVSNKLGAEKAKNIQFKGGKYFDESGKRLKKADVEKGAGVKYSQKAKRFVDVKTGKFVSEKKARQRMNLMPKGEGTSKATSVMAAPSSVAGAGQALAAGAKMAAPSGGSESGGLSGTTAEFRGSGLERRGMASKVLKDETPMEEEDPNTKKIKKIDKNVETLLKGNKDILDMFSINKFYALIGGAIGAAIPLLKKAVAFIWDIGKKGVEWISDLATSVWDKIKEFLTGIKLEIPEIMRAKTIDLPGLDPFTLGPIGGFAFEPFKFLGTSKPTEGPSTTEVGSIEKAPVVPGAPPAPAPASGGGGRRGRRGGPAGGGGGGGGGGGVTPAPAPTSAGGVTPAPAPTSAGGGSEAAPSGTAPAPETTTAAPAAGAGAATGGATRQGTSMPGAAAPAPTDAAPPGGKFKSPDEFVNTMMPWAEYASKALGGTPPLGILGQWAGESGQGKSLPASFNYAGIKAGTKYKKGDYVLTEEKYNAAQLERAQKSGETLHAVLGPNDKIMKKGRQVTIDEWFGKGEWQKAKDQGLQWVQVKSYFAQFSDLKDFADSYVGVLKNKRYAEAVAATTPEEFGYKVAAAGYATASPGKYASKVGTFAKNFQGTTGQAPDGTMYAAAGGVASGPKTGYNAVLHGEEAIVPLDGQSYQSKKAVTNIATAILSTPTSGDQLAAATTDAQAIREASAAPTVIPVPMGGGGAKAAPPQPSGGAVRASVRDSENSFVRALAKDFAHPSTFTTVGSV